VQPPGYAEPSPDGLQVSRTLARIPGYRAPRSSTVDCGAVMCDTGAAGSGGTRVATRENGTRDWMIFQIQLFLNDARALLDMGWQLPADVNLDYVQCVASGSDSCTP
jgi:hypothetical protein